MRIGCNRGLSAGEALTALVRCELGATKYYEHSDSVANVANEAPRDWQNFKPNPGRQHPITRVLRLYFYT